MDSMMYGRTRSIIAIWLANSNKLSILIFYALNENNKWPKKEEKKDVSDN